MTTTADRQTAKSCPGRIAMARTPLLSCSLLFIGMGLAAGANAQTYSKTEAITYHDSTAKWVLGQTAKVTCDVAVPANPACNGDVVSQTTFDSTYAVPLITSSFGKLQQTMTYDTTSTVESGQRGTLKTVSDGRDTGTYNTTVTFSSWKRGIPQTIVYPPTPDQATASKSAVVDNLGQITSVTNEVGLTTSYTYDAMGRLASINYPDEPSPAPAYNNTTISFAPVATTEYGIPAGHWRQTVDTGNGRQVTYFDAMWRPLVEDRYDEGNVAATRSVVAKRYDAAGRLAFQSYPRSSITSYADTTLTGAGTLYDALGRVTFVNQDSELGVLQTKTEYLTGFQTKITNPRAQVTTTSYLTWDQPTTDLPVSITHPEGAYTTIIRDPFGKPTSIKRHDSTSSIASTRNYVYYGSQELCKVIEPEAGATVMGYDAAGNLVWSASGQNLPNLANCDVQYVNATHKAIRSYDQRNRVKTLSFSDGRGDTTYGYTPDGLLASIAANNDASNIVTHNYSYNNRRLLTNEKMLWGNINWNVAHAYNANGHLVSETFPGNLAIAYAPNALGQPTQAGAYATGVSYHPNGGIKQFTYGNGIVHTMTQNTRHLPDRSLDAYGTTKYLDDGYDYDQNANVAAITDGATGQNQRGNRTMTYDGLDRLKTTISSMYGLMNAHYSYDVLDNLTRVKIGGVHVRDHWYCYDANWLLTNVKTTSCGGATVVGLDYDVQGNLNNKNGTTYAFDYGNRLRLVDPAGTTEPNVNYVYDGHGRRVRDLTDEARYSFYTQSGQLAFTSDYRANKFTNYIYLGGSLVATREWAHGTTSPFTVKYQHTDALGSPVVVTDANRNVLERSEYEPYGQVLNRPVSDGPGYTGHVMDAATGLAYMQQRYYDPMIGRFLSVDPVTADGATGANFNRYWYGNNNPYRFTDPDGRLPNQGGGSHPEEDWQERERIIREQQERIREAELAAKRRKSDRFAGVSSSANTTRPNRNGAAQSGITCWKECLRAGWGASFNIRTVFGATIDFGSVKLADQTGGHWTPGGYVGEFSEGRSRASLSLFGIGEVSATGVTRDNGRTWEQSGLEFQKGPLIQIFTGEPMQLDVNIGAGLMYENTFEPGL